MIGIAGEQAAPMRTAAESFGWRILRGTTVNRSPTKEIVKSLLAVAPYMKSPVFSSEQEWRIGRFQDRTKAGGRSEDLIAFDVSRGQLVPHTYVDLRDPGTRFLPVVEVMLGPTVNAAAARRSLRLYLDLHGHKEAAISQSSLPLRFEG
jgi:hypothetical protein